SSPARRTPWRPTTWWDGPGRPWPRSLPASARRWSSPTSRARPARRWRSSRGSRSARRRPASEPPLPRSGRSWRSSMNCDGVGQQIPDYVLGTLSETETAVIRRHLRGCASCRQDATELDQGVALFAGAAHVADPPPELKARVLAVLEEEWAEPATSTPRRRRFHVVAQAMAAAVIALAGLSAWAGIAQSNANHFREDALAYRQFLSALGGKDVRAGTVVA